MKYTYMWSHYAFLLFISAIRLLQGVNGHMGLGHMGACLGIHSPACKALNITCATCTWSWKE